LRIPGSRTLVVAPVALAIIGCRDATGVTTHVHTRWYQKQVGYAETRPAISGNLVIFGTGDGKIVARRQGDGTPAWTTAVSLDPILGARMIVRSNIVIVPILVETVALDVANGRVVWRYSAPADTAWERGQTYPGELWRSHIAADSQTVFIPAWGASVSAVDVRTGSVRWIWQPSRTASDTAARGVFRSGSQGVAVSGDTVYATAWHFLNADGLASEAWLVALDRATGHELWRLTMPSYTSGAFVRGAPVVSGRIVAFETAGGHEFGIDRFTAQLAWEYKPQTQHSTEAETELYDHVVYHDGGDGYIYALRIADGSQLWRATTDLSLGGAITNRDMLITERRVTFSDGMTLHVLDREDGHEIAQTKQPGTWDSFFASPAAYSNGRIFVTVGDGAWSFDEP
jgi:outer membrane protein assembly factor BamB